MFGGATIGSFTATLGLDTKDYARGIINADAMNRVFGNSIATFIANPMLGVLDLTRKFIQSSIGRVRALAEEGEALHRLSQQAGIASDQIQAIESAVALAFGTHGLGHQAILRFARALGDARREGGAIADLFDSMGLDISQDNTRVLLDTIDALSQIEDQATRTSMAIQFFGRSGGPELAQEFAQGRRALQENYELMRRFGQIDSPQTTAFLSEINTSIGSIQLALDGVIRQLTIGFLQGLAGADADAKSVQETVAEITSAIINDGVPAMRDIAQIVRTLLVDAQAIRDIINALRIPEQLQNLSIGARGLTGGEFEARDAQAIQRVARSRWAQLFRSNGLTASDVGRFGQ